MEDLAARPMQATFQIAMGDARLVRLLWRVVQSVSMIYLLSKYRVRDAMMGRIIF